MNGRKQIVWLVVVALVATIAFVLVGNSVAARPSEIEQSAYSPTPTPTREPEREPFVPSRPQISVTGIITDTPQAVAQAMGIRVSDIVSASLNGSDVRGVGIGTTPLGNYFPTEGNTYVILSTGLAESADDPNDSGSLSFQLDGLSNSQGNDLVQLALWLRVPQNMNCASFDFAYFSEEFPEWVGSQYNDTFTAELGGTNLTISGTQVIAPLNFAFDAEGNIISINTVFGVLSNTATTYDVGTSLLRAQTPVTPGATINVVFSVQDLGDSVYDSAVFLDKFFWSNDPNCGSGAQEDTDGDGLLDIWETQGLTVTVDGVDVFVDLPAMGADPERKDIFVEIDYMVDQGICLPIIGCLFGHSHQPKPEAITRIVEAFSDAPVPNPDGSTGISLHVDYGPDSVMNPVTGERWGNRSQANSLPHDNNLGSKNPDGSYNWTEFDTIKNANFSRARAAVFHYCVFAHNLGGFGSVSGISRGIGASDFIVSLGSWSGGVGTVNEQAGTFMHELGHNLGLRHGGDDHTNYEPNFLSIMNYSFQTRGLRINGQDGHFDYSRFALPDLDENNLDETAGLNGGAAINDYGTRYYCAGGGDRIVDNANSPIDWNCDGNSTDTNVQTDVNKDSNRGILRSYNDWANLVFTGGAIGQPGAEPELPMETEVEEITQEEDAELTTHYKVAVTAPSNAATLPGSTVVYTFTVTNLGINADTYTVTVGSSLGWANLSGIPTSLALSGGASMEIPIAVNVPLSASSEAMDELAFSVVSQVNPLVGDSAIARTSVVRRVFLPLVTKGE
jgi:hypothetical protein